MDEYFLGQNITRNKATVHSAINSHLEAIFILLFLNSKYSKTLSTLLFSSLLRGLRHHYALVATLLYCGYRSLWLAAAGFSTGLGLHFEEKQPTIFSEKCICFGNLYTWAISWKLIPGKLLDRILLPPSSCHRQLWSQSGQQLQLPRLHSKSNPGGHSSCWSSPLYRWERYRWYRWYRWYRMERGWCKIINVLLFSPGETSTWPGFTFRVT